jgi:hypothetical protein
MTGILPLLLVAQAQAHLQLQVLLLLAVEVVAAALLRVLLVGQGVQVVVGVRLLLAVEELPLRLVKEVLVDRILVAHRQLAVVVEERVRLVIPTVRVKVEMELHLLLQEHR